MTPDEFKKEMEKIYPKNAIHETENAEYDIAESHINADMLICKILIMLGYEDGVKSYRMGAKWYE